MLGERAAGCTACELHKKRTKIVVARGNPSARILIVGEAPGEQEDLDGLPFVGPSGKRLDKMLGAAGFDSERDVYIVNAVKCRPPENRKPGREEIEACAPFLREQIEATNPRCVVALGAIAVHALTGQIGAITKIRGAWTFADGIPLMPTFHPSYVLRMGPSTEKIVVGDLRAVFDRFGPARRGITTRSEP
jgi:DNA polymerase